MKKTVYLIPLVGMLLSSCGTIENTSHDFIREQVNITHTITIDGVKTSITEAFTTNPSRVATFNFGVLDMFDTLGFEHLSISSLGLPKASVPASLNAYSGNNYENIGTLFEPDYTALDFFDPELIILDGRSSALYEDFKDRYPSADILDANLTTYNFVTQAEVAHNIGKIFTSVTDDIDAILEEIETRIAAIHGVASTHEALFILSNGDALSAYGNVGRYNSIYTDFGFIQAVDGLENSGSHGTPINKEYLTEHDPEIIFIMDRAAAIGETSGLESFQADPLVKTLRAYQNNDIYLLDAQAWYVVTGGFRSTRQMIQDVDQFSQLFND